MNYSEFNARIFQYYLNQVGSSFSHLGMSVEEFENILPLEKLKNLHALSTPWSYLLRVKNEEPQYFGLLAVQCLATSLMERDQQFSSQAYQIRFIQLTGISTGQRLQSLFKEPVNGRPVQECLWEAARDFFSNQLGKQLRIPNPTCFRGRFVQYPLSQALLKKEDLKSFNPLFEKYLKAGENISIPDFESRILSKLDEINLGVRAHIVLTDELTKDAAIRQVFNQFLLWDGFIEEVVASLPKTLTEKPNEHIILRVQSQTFQFFHYPEMCEITFLAMWRTRGFNDQHPSLKIFNAHEYYTDEFEEGRLLIQGVSAWLLFDIGAWPRLFSYFNSCQQIQMQLDGIYAFCYISDTQLHTASILRALFTHQKPVTLKGGLKVSRGRIYLEGFGPSIISSGPHLVIHNGQKCEYEPYCASPGIYHIRTDLFRDTIFTIIHASPLFEAIESKRKGWNLSFMSISDKVDIEGALFYGNEHEYPMVLWRKLHGGELSSLRKKFHNPLFQVLVNYYEQND